MIQLHPESTKMAANNAAVTKNRIPLDPAQRNLTTPNLRCEWISRSGSPRPRSGLGNLLSCVKTSGSRPRSLTQEKICSVIGPGPAAWHHSENSQRGSRVMLDSLVLFSAGSSCRSNMALQLMMAPESSMTGWNRYSDWTGLESEPTTLWRMVSPRSHVRVKSSAG